jgi:hypothetical protein
MEFLRWLVLQTEKDFVKTGAFIPCFAVNVILVGFSFAISLIFGTILSTISVIWWGFFAYVFISREMKNFYERYEREKTRVNTSNDRKF